jgi:oligoendopeptidase F
MKSTNLPYSLSKWSLADLFPSADGDKIKATLAEVDKQVAEFEKQRSLLTSEISSSAFLDLIHQQEAFSRLLFRLGAYAYLWFSEDTQNQAAVNLRAQVDQFGAVIQNRILFFSLWWKDLDEDNAQRLMLGAGDYRYWLEEIRHFIPYTLTEPEEKIINLKDVTGVSAWRTFYKTLTNRYVFKLTVDGIEKELTRGELSVYVRHPDPKLREAAYQELYRVYNQDASLLGMIYQNLVRDWHNEQVDLRKFSSPISVRNLSNDIPDEVVDTLLDVSQKNAMIFHRFFRLKARWLGMERLRRYDIYAPVVESDKTYPYVDAISMVLDAFEQFDTNVAGLARRVLDQKHLDSEVRKGKEDGAYCYSVNPELTPWVLVNYQGRPDDVATLAHELGHAIHAMLADKHTLFT